MFFADGATDYVRVRTYQSSGGALAIEGHSTIANNLLTSAAFLEPGTFSIKMLGSGS